ncbi:Hypothetical predicted protein [Mytilus galloprovincialis]|uniref:Thyroglobulin type-1 domain-containing protein n=1 Tax=Mytilus galloprovincialis TaxID=29158 RepID=A0A8B6HRW2_MYTGA|nr:Hypothetical predicted protein [Mytilus galloprovincialis]
MQYLIPILILFNCLIIQGIRDWRIVGKVTDYGQNVSLFCNVPNCCPKNSGWYKWTSKHDKLLIDIKSGYLSKKYGGKLLKDGFTLVIQNLTSNDLNVWYSCIYNSTIGERKYLQEEDVFVFDPNTRKESIPKNKTACQQLRLSSIDFSSHVPECTTIGEYKTRQCEGRRYKTCWCVDPNGRQIPGSQLMDPEVPDCAGGFPSWSLSSNPKIFGKSFDLTCSMSATGRNGNVQSKQDGSIDINVLDGEPVNDINQLGKRHTFKRMYILTTSVYDNDGVKVEYECGHGNTRYGHVLNMTIESYEYIDNANNCHQLVNHEVDLFSMTFRNYTQIPQCSVVYGQADYSKELQSTFDSRNQAYRIYLPVTAVQSKCPKTLIVTCKMGTKRIVNTLQPDNADCLHATLKQKQRLQGQDKDQTLGIVGLVIFMIFFVAVVGSCIGYIVIMECKRVFKRYTRQI